MGGYYDRAERRGLSMLAALIALPILCTSCLNTQGGATTPPTSSASVQETIVAIGQQATTQAGNLVTVFSYVSPVRGARAPAAGMIFSAAEVQACAGPRAPSGTTVSRSQFALETPDQGGWASVDAVKTPALQRTLLSKGQCARGWITFQLPANKKAQYVVLISSNIVKWQVP